MRRRHALDLQKLLSAGLLVALLLGLWLAQLWSAEMQVRLHSEHLLRQIEKRNWTAAGEFVAAE
jgi:hypothetical protein